MWVGFLYTDVLKLPLFFFPSTSRNGIEPSVSSSMVKAGIALCLRDRAENICGAGSSVLQEEKEHLKGVLQANGYPNKVAARHMKKRQQNQGSRVDVNVNFLFHM